MERPNIGMRIREARRSKGFTQEQLAEILGTSKAAISRYESQQREPRIGQLIAIAAALDVSLAQLQGVNEETGRFIAGKVSSGEIHQDDYVLATPNGDVYLATYDKDDPSVAERHAKRSASKQRDHSAFVSGETFYGGNLTVDKVTSLDNGMTEVTFSVTPEGMKLKDLVGLLDYLQKNNLTGDGVSELMEFVKATYGNTKKDDN